MLTIIIIVIISYLLGSFPTSILVSKAVRKIDIREHGSGNAGGTNSVRVLGWKWGLLVVLVDIGKGMAATLLISKIRVGPPVLYFDIYFLQIIAGSSAVIGHIWSIFASFKGGKGVATAGGMLLALFPWASLTLLALFVSIAAATRLVSLASLSTLLALPLVLVSYDHVGWERVPAGILYLSVLLFLLVLYTHRANVKRLVAGKENRLHGSYRPPE